MSYREYENPKHVEASMKRELQILKNERPLHLQYINCVFPESDTETEIYDTCKLVVLLTDDLVAILNEKLIGGKKGDILLFSPDEIHFGRFLRQGNHRFLEIYFPLSFLEDVFYDADTLSLLFSDSSENRINCLRGNPNEIVEITECAEKIITLLQEESKINTIEIFMHILKILTVSTALYKKSKENSVSDITTPSYVIRTIEYIAKHYSEKIKIYDISSTLGCSEAYLSRLFKKYTGISIYGYITGHRINMAKKFLKSDLSVTEVCYLTGFNDCSNFIETFKKLTGYTPLKYKNIVSS